MKVKVEYYYPSSKYTDVYEGTTIVVNNMTQEEVKNILSISEELLNCVDSIDEIEWNDTHEYPKLTAEQFEHLQDIRDCGFGVSTLLDVAGFVFNFKYEDIGEPDFTYTMED